MVTALNRQRLPYIQQASQCVLTIKSIKSMAEQIKSYPKIHTYHKKQAIFKITETKAKFQYYQKTQEKKTYRRKLPSDPLKITSFLNL